MSDTFDHEADAWEDSYNRGEFPSFRRSRSRPRCNSSVSTTSERTFNRPTFAPVAKDPGFYDTTIYVGPIIRETDKHVTLLVYPKDLLLSVDDLGVGESIVPVLLTLPKKIIRNFPSKSSHSITAIKIHENTFLKIFSSK